MRRSAWVSLEQGESAPQALLPPLPRSPGLLEAIFCPKSLLTPTQAVFWGSLYASGAALEERAFLSLFQGEGKEQRCALGFLHAFLSTGSCVGVLS